MRTFIVAALLLVSFRAEAQLVASTSRGIVVAEEGQVTLYDMRGDRIWSASGLKGATAIVAGEDRVALLDAWSNEARIISLVNGHGQTRNTGETPIGGVFVSDDLVVIERDKRSLTHFRSDGTSRSTTVAADPAFIRQSGQFVYVYSRSPGLLQEVDVSGEMPRIVRTAPVPSFAADMEVDRRTAYLLLPREAKLAAIDLDDFSIEMTAAGGAPTDLSLTRRGNAVSAPLIAIADPSAKRLWMTEGAQSVGAAFGRGFLRGLLGLGAGRSRSPEFPTGIDRVVSGEGVTAAYDSASRTLYTVDRSRTKVIAEDIGPQAFAATGDRIAFWDGDALRFAN
jgi:hypothetical protein